MSGHKFGGPQGVGALWRPGRCRPEPLIHGGGQERERRSGTHNVAGIVGLAAALTATVADRDRRPGGRSRRSGTGWSTGCRPRCPASSTPGGRRPEVAGIAHLRIDGVESEALLVLLDDAGVCASAGSSCASGAVEPATCWRPWASGARGPHRPPALARATTTDAEAIDLALAVVAGAVGPAATEPA